MTSNTSLVIPGLLLVFIAIVVQSVPIEKASKVEDAPLADHKPSDRRPVVPVKPAPASPSSSTTTSTPSSPSAAHSKPKDGKKKRNIQLDELFGDNVASASDESDEVSSHFQLDNHQQPIEHVLHPKMQETPLTVHDHADKPVGTDDSSAFSDARMTPDELTDIVRRRRDVKLSGDANRRRKRALTSYDLYDTNPFYDAYTDLLDGYQHARSARSFAPIYWYPSVNERNIRAALTSSYYGASAWPRLYASDLVDDDDGDVDDDNSLVTIYREDDGDDDVNDYELNRYPILLQTANQPFDNLQLQQRYNTDDLPVDEDFEDSVNYDLDSYGEAAIDDDDDTERYRSFLNKQHPSYARYEPVQTYFE